MRRVPIALTAMLLIASGPREEQVQLAPNRNLDGEWRVVGYEQGGDFAPPVLEYRWLISGGRIKSLDPDKNVVCDTRLVFPTNQDPAAVDVMTIRDDGKVIDINRAIYLLEGKSLKFYWGTLGPEPSIRPTAFTTKGTSRAATVLERIRP